MSKIVSLFPFPYSLFPLLRHEPDLARETRRQPSHRRTPDPFERKTLRDVLPEDHPVESLVVMKWSGFAVVHHPAHVGAGAGKHPGEQLAPAVGRGTGVVTDSTPPGDAPDGL